MPADDILYIGVSNALIELESTRDGGCALIAKDIEFDPFGTSMFIRLQSWDDTKAHATLHRLLGRRVSIRIEVHPEETE